MRRNILIICFVLFCILIAFMINNRDTGNKNYVTIPNNRELVIDNILPLSDKVGSTYTKSNEKANIFYRFKVVSNNKNKVNYKILLTTKTGEQFIKDEYIKITLSDSNDKILKKYDSDSFMFLNGLDKYNKSYVLDTNTLKNKGSREYILRMWVSDVTTYDDNLIFDGKLSVYSY